MFSMRRPVPRAARVRRVTAMPAARRNQSMQNEGSLGREVICTWGPRFVGCRRRCSCITSVLCKKGRKRTHRQQRKSLPRFAQHVACKHWSELPSSIDPLRKGPPAPQLHLLIAEVSAAERHAVAHPTGIKMASSGWQKPSSYIH